MKRTEDLPPHLKWGYCRTCKPPLRITIIDRDFGQCIDCTFDTRYRPKPIRPKNQTTIFDARWNS